MPTVGINYNDSIVLDVKTSNIALNRLAEVFCLHSPVIFKTLPQDLGFYRSDIFLPKSNISKNKISHFLEALSL